MDPTQIHSEFPAPSYRGYQQQALHDIKTAFQQGNKVVLVQAPTGSGKSLLARAVAGCARSASGQDEDVVAGAYYTTPQVSQIDDVREDDFVDDISIISGKSNYACILPDETTSVPAAPCSRNRNYDCHLEEQCPYFVDRKEATEADIAGMTLAYFMETALSDVFGNRDVIVIDEAHGLPTWAQLLSKIDVSPGSVPNWSDLKPNPAALTTFTDIRAYISELVPYLNSWQDQISSQSSLSSEQAAIRDQIQVLKPDLRWFLDDTAPTNGSQETHGATNPEKHTGGSQSTEESPFQTDGGSSAAPSDTTIIEQTDTRLSGYSKDGGWAFEFDHKHGLTLQPLSPQRFLSYSLWDRGQHFALLSATLLDADAFCTEVGLNPDDATLVEMPSTFPLENRPLVDATVGPMTADERAETLPKMIELIESLLQHHRGEKGIIHSHSYEIKDAIADELSQRPAGADRIITHDRHDRDEVLDSWRERDDDSVFVSVSMEEALDLKYDLARWQVICKAPYPHTHDPLVAYRLQERQQWDWYYRTTLRTLIQACGRVVRAPDDNGVTYLADSSILDVFDRAEHHMPAWFSDQVEDMTELSVTHR